MSAVNLLAFETSSEAGSVALRTEEAIEERRIDSPRRQAEQLLPLVQELLASANLRLADLHGIAFGRGPGSFTGLRVAAAAAQGLGLASGLPLLPVSSLAAVAQGLWRSRGATAALVCVDARMAEVFWAGFEMHDGLARPMGEERLSAPAAVSAAGLENWTAAGSGFAAYETVLAPLVSGARSVCAGARPRARDLFPQAADDLAARRVCGPEAAMPVYLRSEAAWET